LGKFGLGEDICIGKAGGCGRKVREEERVGREESAGVRNTFACPSPSRFTSPLHHASWTGQGEKREGGEDGMEEGVGMGEQGVQMSRTRALRRPSLRQVCCNALQCVAVLFYVAACWLRTP